MVTDHKYWEMYFKDVAELSRNEAEKRRQEGNNNAAIDFEAAACGWDSLADYHRHTERRK